MITLTERSKKIIFIIFFIVFTLGTGYALYYFFFRPLAPTVQPSNPQETYGGELESGGKRGTVITALPKQTGGLPTAGQIPSASVTAPGGQALASNTTLLRDSVTQAVSQSTSGNIRFYNPQDGKFYMYDAEGNLIPLSARQFYNVDNVTWGKTAQEAILEFPDGSNIYYNFDTQRQTTLPKQWEDFQFSPSESQIVAKNMGLDEDNRYLITAKPDGNEATALYHMGANANLVIPSWSPNNQVIGFSKTGTPQPDNGEQIVMLGKNHENLKALNVAGYGFQPNWSPNGKRILYSVYHARDNYKPMLWVSDAYGQDIGNNRKKLNLITWADKCTWADANTIFCAVPVELPIGAGYDEKAFRAVSDDIYRIDLTTGVAKRVNSQDQKHSVTQPIISQDQKTLTFTDGSTGYLYSYKLNP